MFTVQYVHSYVCFLLLTTLFQMACYLLIIITILHLPAEQPALELGHL